MSDLKEAEKAYKKLIEKTRKREFTKLSTESRRLKRKSKMTALDFREKTKFTNSEFKLGELYVDDYSQLQKLGETAKELFFENLETKRILDEQKNEHAAEAFVLGETFEKLGLESGEFMSYDKDTLNTLMRIADYPSGSREWLEARQKGIGGSDVGSILKVDPEWGDRDYKDVFNSKIFPITDEQVLEQEAGQVEFNDAASRGNAWEFLIGKMFADANPETQVIICKASWAKTHERIMRVNFDFLLSRTKGDGKPTGLLEIKTASDPALWGKPEDGLDAVPAKYRAQVLHGAIAAGFSWGAIAVLIDGYDFRYYTFEMTEELIKEAWRNATECRRFWNKVKVAREEESVRMVNEELAPEPKKTTKGFSSVLSQRGEKGNNARKSMILEIAQLMKATPSEVLTRYRSIRAFDEDFEHRNAVEAFRDLYKAAISEVFTNYERIVAVDIETSGNTPISGSIIEIGISVRDSNNNEVDSMEELYGITENEMNNGGTGSEDVHNINVQDILGKPLFTEKENQEKVLELLKSGLVLAHNKSFEIAWFRQNLPGFVDAELNGEINIIDTMDLCKRFLPDAPGNRLQDFMEYFGMEYVDMHRAHKDAFFTAECFYKLYEMN